MWRDSLSATDESTMKKNKAKVKAGKLGGQAGTGKSKRRGDSNFYRELVAKREAKRLTK